MSRSLASQMHILILLVLLALGALALTVVLAGLLIALFE